MPGFIKPAINQRLIKMLGLSWEARATGENEHNWGCHSIGTGIFWDGDRSVLRGAELSGVWRGPRHPAIAAVLMWTAGEVNLNSAV